MGSLPIGRTFIPSEIENATFMNSLSTAVNFLLNPPRCQLFNSTGPTLVNNTYTTLTWDSEQYDTDTMHNPSVNPSRITPQTPGLYLVMGQVDFQASGTGARQVGIRANGGDQAFDLNPPNASGNTVVHAAKELYFNGSTDYVELAALQVSGGPLALSPGLSTTWFSARWVANS